MSDLILTEFVFNAMPVRVVQADGEPWFVAADVCAVLGLGNVSMALERLDDDEKGVSSIDTLGGAQQMAVINESGLYSLVLGSRKPDAKPFKKWVTAEVLPSIRKTGAYSVTQEAIPQTYAQALLEAGRLALQVEQQEAALALAAPKVEFMDNYVQASTGSLGFRQVCKLLKVKEPAFREFLLAEKIMYYLGGTLTAYQNHLDAGRFEVKTGVANSEHAYSSTKFSAKGVTWVAGEWAKHQARLALAEVAV